MTAIRLSFAIIVAASLVACASAPPRKLPGNEIDTQKVVTVNQWAEKRGAKLIWVHYPTVERTALTD
jgi:hypothetical protein